MQCVVCTRDFNAKRDTAKFCSPSCRVKFNRASGLLPEKKSPEKLPTEIASESTELTREELDQLRGTKLPSSCCESCTELPTFGHFCPNKKCGCLQTNEEQEADILVIQRDCAHGDIYLARCTECMAYIKQEKRTGEKNFLKKSAKKE